MKSGYSYISELADLIFRCFTGQISKKEERQLDDWRESSPHHEQLYRKFTSEQFISEKFRFVEENNVEDAYAEFLQKVEWKIRKKRRLHLYRYAAVAVLFLSFGAFTLLRQISSETELSLVRPITPVGYKAILTLGNGEIIHLYDTTYSSYSIQKPTHGQPDSLQYRTITIPRGGEYVLDLSDGTRVWLNSESEIHFPQQFAGKCREVVITGEVYFQVARDTSCPFIIHTGKGDIRVLGTSFNVRDYDYETFLETTLVSGKIAFCHLEKEILLSPGEQLRLDRKSGEVSVMAVNTQLFCSWKDGRLVFEKERLADIMSTIALWYDVEVVFENEDLENLLFTGNVKRYDDLEALLDMLRLINKVNIRVEGRKIMICQ